MEQIISKLHEIEAIKFGTFTLKSGITSPIYIDLRRIISYPSLLSAIADAMWDRVNQLDFDLICGVPYTALPIATAISLKHSIPMIMRRKEAKEYGTKKIIEGVYQPEQKCLIVEDLITSGASIFETIEPVESEELNVSDIICFINREQGGKRRLDRAGYTLHSCTTISTIMNTLHEFEKIDSQTVQQVEEFLYANQF